MLAMLGWLLIVVGAIWLVVVSIQTGKTTGEKVIWALVNFFCQPLGGIVFYFVQKQGMVPLLMVIAGWILMIFGGGMAMFSAYRP
ncbi:MAG TPA: hypothetical protein PKC89_10795 [Pyrinomonadaceae bacterium]|nr:hypothetical protein [Pyrinomonadaceae bacterium]